MLGSTLTCMVQAMINSLATISSKNNSVKLRTLRMKGGKHTTFESTSSHCKTQFLLVTVLETEFREQQNTFICLELLLEDAGAETPTMVADFFPMPLGAFVINWV